MVVETLSSEFLMIPASARMNIQGQQQLQPSHFNLLDLPAGDLSSLVSYIHLSCLTHASSKRNLSWSRFLSRLSLPCTWSWVTVWSTLEEDICDVRELINVFDAFGSSWLEWANDFKHNQRQMGWPDTRCGSIKSCLLTKCITKYLMCILYVLLNCCRYFSKAIHSLNVAI